MYKIDLNHGVLLTEKFNISDQIIYENIYQEIINESYIPIEYFQRLFDKINNGDMYQIFNKSDLLSLFPARWKAKKYLKNRKIKGNLIVFKIDWTNTNEIIDCLKFLQTYTQRTLTKKKFQNLCMQVISALTNTQNSALFMQLNEVTTYSLMFLKQNFLIDDLKHEFIHYYQWVTHRELVDINVDLATIDEIPVNLSKFCGSNLIDFELDNLVNKHELIPYINTFIDQLKLFNLETNKINKYQFLNIKFIKRC